MSDKRITNKINEHIKWLELNISPSKELPLVDQMVKDLLYAVKILLEEKGSQPEQEMLPSKQASKSILNKAYPELVHRRHEVGVTTCILGALLKRIEALEGNNINPIPYNDMKH